MNNPELSTPPEYEAVLKPVVSLGAPSLSGGQSRGHATSSVRDSSLYLAWSNVRGIASTRVARGADAAQEITTPVFVPTWSGDRDLGLWLFGNIFIRREGWSRLNTEPTSHLSIRPHYAAIKRVGDIAGSLALLILLLPVLALVAALVKLDSPGPVFFRQRRVGKDGAQFLLWKFRSMCADAPEYALSPTSKLDPRLTRIGWLIRRVSFDELPQLINVLKGEMSLVGPRPEMPFIASRYSALELRRLAIKPGITGLWQISPARAAPIHENLQYDLHYIQHQNLMLDGAILLRTIVAVVRGVGAV